MTARNHGESQSVTNKGPEPASSPAYRINSEYNLRMMLVLGLLVTGLEIDIDSKLRSAWNAPARDGRWHEDGMSLGFAGTRDWTPRLFC